MICPHCVARVEKAILGVDQVPAVNVQLEAGQAQVTGGKPHQVIAAIEAAGYDARPLADAPDTCSAERQTPQHLSTPAAEGSYRIDIDDMSCASCVARVEKAILAVDGVSDASVNLVEGAAYVLGGDAKAVANAIIDQGYPARGSTDQPLGRFDWFYDNHRCPALNKSPVDTLLNPALSDKIIHWPDNRQCEFEATAHPVDYLLALEQAGLRSDVYGRYRRPLYCPGPTGSATDPPVSQACLAGWCRRPGTDGGHDDRHTAWSCSRCHRLPISAAADSGWQRR